MRAIIGGAIVAAGLLAAPLGGTLARGQTAAPASLMMGVNTHFQWFGAGDVRNQFTWITNAHLASVRFDENWSRLEPARGVWDGGALAGLDTTINLLTANGVQPIITFVTTPGWANSNAGIWAPPTNMNDYGEAIAYLANRYKATNTVWEVWNEPDYHAFWTTGPNATQYAAMVESAYDHIKAVAPSVTVAAGSLNHNDQAFLQGMYAAGVKGHFDALSIHPYCFSMAPSDPDAHDNGEYSFAGAITDSEATMASHGQPNMPIYITEMGWKVPDVPETSRAQYMQAAVSIAGSYPYVRAIEPFVMQDNSEPQYSLIQGGSPTQSWNAYVAMHPASAPQSSTGSVQTAPVHAPPAAPSAPGSPPAATPTPQPSVQNNTAAAVPSQPAATIKDVPATPAASAAGVGGAPLTQPAAPSVRPISLHRHRWELRTRYRSLALVN